ncbi:hypothetical protein LEN26_003002 [Aphanomyces euteiches]|uniref:Organic hydroperoxide resistance protein n=1 Tax=Aphanomyces euteiches TaxID=100861 RepID=A0A6G0XUJ4_9STRA|nr:hypothetical protein Ae201684_001270 [Aphanomyces euteiches]KAH9099900.1 hypothetical protein Ae201684P_018908 [Aphanomyces euteiches]KAH9125534.1 hypothetical protein AeMF1_003866 [Aphanomyces euteiches]KAH9135713.1 hypothetical protein AeRB84_018929 [Aphanomyces euteiches]KAH9158402.1 hypothetical protein LEN26_003002 [Aphanomyces euteiches]
MLQRVLPVARRASLRTSASRGMATNVLEKVVYTAHVTTTGGREGHSKSTDGGKLDIKLGTAALNPEQLFAAGYSACFIGALKVVAGKEKVTLPEGLKVDASVDLGPIPTGFGIAAKLVVHLPGLEKSAAQKLVDAADIVCPYSNAIRGNIVKELVVKN